MTINQLIKTKSSWTKGVDARDKNGYPINISTIPYQRGPRLKDVQSFSLYGAVIMAYSQEDHPDKRADVMRKLGKAIKQYTGKDIRVAAFNDAPTTSYEDVEKVLKIFKSL